MLDDFIQDVFKNQNTSLDTSPREFSRKEYERIALEEYPLTEKNILLYYKNLNESFWFFSSIKLSKFFFLSLTPAQPI